MQFTTIALTALAGLTSAAVVPRADFGFWAVTWTETTLTANYTSTELEEPIITSCTSEPGSTPVCDTPFFYSFGTNETSHKQTISLRQTVPLFGESVTVFGDADVVEEGSATVFVTRAIA